MSPALQVESAPGSVVTVLAISSRKEELSALHSILDHSNWVLREARDCRQALDLLRNSPASVIVCEDRLDDGTWRDVQRAVAGFDSPPPVVVSSMQADDRMWAEVLNLGGYDVLPEPFENDEVIRILSLAWLHWRDTCRSARKGQGRVMAMAAAG